MPSPKSSQVTGDRPARGDLRRLSGRSIFVRLAPPGRIHKPKRLGVIKQGIEHRPGIKHRDLVQIFMFGLKLFNGASEIRIEIRQERRDARYDRRALL